MWYTCIPCKDCPATYVGETTRRLVKRLDEHKRAVRKGEMKLSALAKHAWKEGHGVDWGKVAVLDHHHSLHERLSFEAYYIRRQPLALNSTKVCCLMFKANSLVPSKPHHLWIVSVSPVSWNHFYISCELSLYFRYDVPLMFPLYVLVVCI